MEHIFPFSRSYPETESTWSTARCRWRKPFDTWYYIVTCGRIYISFSSKSKATNNVFPKHSEIKSTWSINSSKEETVNCCMIVKIYLCSTLCKFFMWMVACGGAKSKEQTPQLTLLHWGRTVRSSCQSCFIKNHFLQILQYSQGKKTCVWFSFFILLRAFRLATF